MTVASTQPPQPPSRLRAWWSRRGRWSRRGLVALAALLVLQPIVGFLIVPWVIRSVVVPRIAQRLDGDLSVARVRFNPYTWRLGLDAVALTDADGRLVAGAGRVEVDADPLASLVLPGWRFGDILLEAPFADARYEPGLGIDIARILAGPDDGTPVVDDGRPLRIPRFLIRSLEVREARGSFDDRAFETPIVVRFSGLSFRIERVDTKPPQDGLHAVTATLDGGARVDWVGSLSLDPPRSVGSLSVEGLALQQYAGHSARFTDATIHDGRLDAFVRYRFEPVASPPVVEATIARADIARLVAERAGETLVAQPALELRRADVDAVARSVRIDRLALSGGSLRLERDEEGTFNLAKMIRAAPPAPEDPRRAPATEPAPRGERVDVTTLPGPAQQLITSVSYILEDLTGAWSVALRELEIRDHSIDFRDRSPPRIVEASLRSIDLDAGPVDTETGFVFPFRVTARINDAASSAEGRYGVDERVLDATVATERLALGPFGSYLRLIGEEPFASSDVERGSATVRGHVRFATPEPSRIDLAWRGDVALDELAIIHVPTGDAVLAARAIAIAGDLGAALRTGEETGSERGTTARWKGTFAARTGRAGPALLTTAGLGEGTVATEAIDLEGELDAALPVGADATARWAGRLALTALAAERIGPGGELGAGLDAARLDVTADLAIGAETGAKVDWTGMISSDAMRATIAGDAPIDARAGRLELQGSGVGTIADALHIDWEGVASLASAEASAAASGLRGRTSEASIEGGFTLSRSDESRLAATYRGAARLGEAELERASEGETIRVTQGGTTLDGTASATLDAEGAIGVGLDGALEVTVPTLALSGERTLEGGAAALRLSGTVEGDLADARRSAVFEGELLLEDLGGMIDGAEATTSLLSLGGRATALSEGEETTLSWQGAVKGSDGHILLPAQDPPVALAYGEIGADGELAVEMTAELTAIGWWGRQEARDLLAALAAADGKLEAKVALLRGSNTLSAYVDSALEATWQGTIGLEGSDLSDAATARSARVGSVAIDGTARLSRAGRTEPALGFDGSAIMAAIEAAQGSGADAIRVGNESARFDGSIAIGRDGGGAEDLALRGDLRVEAPRAELGEPVETRAGVGVVEATGLAIDRRQMLIEADSLRLAGAALERLIEPSAAAPPDGVTEERTLKQILADVPWTIRLGQLLVEETTLTLKAPPGEVPESVVVDQVKLELDDLATDGSSSGALRLAGRVAGSGRLGATGTIDPFRTPMVADLVLTIDNAPLPPVNPLTARQLGWRIAGGRLSTRIPTTVQEGQVKGTIEFTLDSVELEGRSRIKGAPDLPLDFALGVLKDSNNQVKGTIPFSGDATKPGFSLGGLIAEVIFSFIGKVVTAPFQLLASAFGGSADIDLSTIPFTAGSSALEADALARIDLLVRALRERPGLRIGVTGHVAADADGRALRLGLLRETVAERARKGFPPRRSVDDALYRKLVTELWRETPEGRALRDQRQWPPFDTMENALLATMPLSDAMLEALAAARVEAIRAAFVGAGIDAGDVVAKPAAPEAFARPQPQASVELELGG